VNSRTDVEDSDFFWYVSGEGIGGQPGVKVREVCASDNGNGGEVGNLFGRQDADAVVGHSAHGLYKIEEEEGATCERGAFYMQFIRFVDFV